MVARSRLAQVGLLAFIGLHIGCGGPTNEQAPSQSESSQPSRPDAQPGTDTTKQGPQTGVAPVTPSAPATAKLPTRDPEKEIAAAAQREKRIQELRIGEARVANAVRLGMSKDWDLPKDVIGVVDISRVDPARKSVFGFAPQISPDGTRLLISEQILNSANTDKAKWRRVHDLTSGEDVCRFDAGPGSRLSTAFSPDGMVVAIGSFDKQITLWDATTGKVRKQFTFDKPVWEKVAYMPDGSGFVACLGGSLVLLDADTGTARRTFGDSSLNAAHAVLSPSGEVLAAYTKSQKSRSLECISIWDVATGGLIKELKPFGSIHSLMFSPDGWIVYSLEWQSDGYLLVAWDLSSGRHRFAIQAKRISNLVLSPDGRLASYYSDSELVVHNLVTGKERRLRSRFGPDGNPAFFPGGTLLATTSNGNFVVWKVAEIEPASGQ